MYDCSYWFKDVTAPPPPHPAVNGSCKRVEVGNTQLTVQQYFDVYYKAAVSHVLQQVVDVSEEESETENMKWLRGDVINTFI